MELELKKLTKEFQGFKAVDDITLTMSNGVYGLLGVNGAGKTTLMRMLCTLIKPTSGSILCDGKDIFKYNHAEQKEFCKKVQMIFQNPYSSLNPRMTVKDIVGEGLKQHGMSTKDADAKVEQLLATVGLNKDHMSRFPHEFSGGQRQRIGIARALSVDPEFIICDEPISALDVSIQAQVVNLLIKLQREFGLTYLFISHDLSMVKHISDRVGVMYLGSMVELASNHDLYDRPLHPYTQALISAIPTADPDVEATRQRIKLEGEVPSPINPPPGCKFRARCRYAMDICATQSPVLQEVEPNHFVACHLCNKNK